MTQSLAQDRPTIDAAIKSYISLVCAKALTASATDDFLTATAGPNSTAAAAVPANPTASEEPSSSTTLLGLIPSAGLGSAASHNNTTNSNKAGVQQHVLQLARIMLQTINQYTFPIHCTVANSMSQKPGLRQDQKDALLELSIAAQLHNGLVQSKQKPSRFLGRRALGQAWKNQLGDEILTKLKNTCQEQDDVVLQQQLQWLQEFERLLFAVPIPDQDDDSALLWAPDGGTQELAKRRTRRQQAATKRENPTTTTSTVLESVTE